MAVTTATMAVLAASAATAVAQPGAAPGDTEDPPPPVVRREAPPKNICALGQALPHCRSILHWELDIGSAGEQGAEGAQAAMFFGLTVNVDPENGVGGLIGFYGGHPYGEVGIKGRYRRWLGDWVAADLEAGIMLPRDELERASAFGWTLGADLSLADCVALTSRLDLFDAGTGREAIGTVGVRIGTVPLWAIATALSGGRHH